MAAATDTAAATGELSFSRPAADNLLVRFSGSWTLQASTPTVEAVRTELSTGGAVRRLSFDAKALGDWDSGLLTFLTQLNKLCQAEGIDADTEGLPEGARRLMKLAAAVPPTDARSEEVKPGFLAHAGQEAIDMVGSLGEMVSFLGDAFIAVGRMFRGKARFQGSDVLLFMQDAGAQALPIVSLISFLVGLILAFVGAQQLQLFGAEIFVANLVGIGMAREMAAIMTGIIMAGRTGAAYAAQLGTMQVNEEIDALETFGLKPMEFLVLPRMMALFLMMPLLVLYSILMGILGGFVVAVFMLDLTGAQYWEQLVESLTFSQIVIGVVKAALYGAIVAEAGCMRGIQCGRSASAVGLAATSAVVLAITMIIVANGVIDVVLYAVGI